jgi:PAS domain-containing protein
VDASDELLRRPESSGLLSPDGIVRSLNAAMAAALGRPAEQCVGRYVWELLPESQRTVVGRIAAQASKQRLAMCLSSKGGSWITSTRPISFR